MLAELSQRDRQAEVMDQPGLDPGRHAHALAGLARLNAWSRSSAIVWSAIRPLAIEQASRPLRVLDIASGAVLVTSIGAATVGLIVLAGPFFDCLG